MTTLQYIWSNIFFMSITTENIISEAAEILFYQNQKLII